MSAPVKQLRPAPPAAAPVPAAPSAPREKSLEYIGSRWTPHHVMRMDRAAGTFEEVNSPQLRQAEDFSQQALLKPIRDPKSLQRIEAARVARRVNQGASQ